MLFCGCAVLRFSSCCLRVADGTFAYRIRPYFRIAASIRSTGIAKIRMSLAPVVVSAASIALVMAASVACAVALKSEERRSFGSMRTVATVSAAHDVALAVLNATKMSPDPLPPKPP